MMRKYIYIAAIAIIAASTVPAASAKNGDHRVRGYKAHAPHNVIQYAQNKISPSQAKTIARNKVRNATVIDVWPQGDIYKVRMQKKNGRVVDVYVDARTGRVR